MMTDNELEQLLDKRVFSAADMLRFASHALTVSASGSSDKAATLEIRRLLELELGRRVGKRRPDIEADVRALAGRGQST